MLKMRVAVLVILLTGYALSTMAQDNAAQAQFEQGNALMAGRQYVSAVEAYRAVAAMDAAATGYRSLAWLRLIQCEIRLDQIDQAKADCATLATWPDAPPHHIEEARAIIEEAERVKNGLPARDPMANRIKPYTPPAPGVELFVSRDGRDENPGTMDAPFATLNRAVEAVAALNANGGLPKGGAQISLRAGTYPVTQTTVINAAAGGREDAPLVIAAYGNETVTLTSAATIAGFAPVEDAAILERLPEEARDHVVVADLKAQGITNYGTLAPRGFGQAANPSMELFVNGAPMQPARWPNEGFLKTGEVIAPATPNGNTPATFRYLDDRPARWTQARDIWMYGYWYYEWADNSIAVTAIDTAAKQISTAQTSTYGIRADQSYYVFNLLEEIDQPGEWYLDRAESKLYLYPPCDLAKASIELSQFTEPFLRASEASYLVLRGLILEGGSGVGVEINGGDHVLVAGCLIRRFSLEGIVINGGQQHGVLSCELHTLGRGGVVMTGGDRKTLTPGGHYVENSHIHHFSRIDRTYTPAVQINGVGNRIAHNDFHDTPCHAIRLEGNDHVVEFNHIHNVVLESDDQGGIDLFLNPGYRGNLLRYNYWHDIGSGRGGCGQAGIRLDDAISGTLIYSNIFQRCAEGNFGGVQIHGGKDNWVDNNLFIECRFGISFSAWGADRWNKFLDSDNIIALLHNAVDISAPPYSTRYPALATLAEGNDINDIWRNITYKCGALMTRDQGIQRTIDNFSTQDDLGFQDAAQNDFRLKDANSLNDRFGFRAIPIDEIGRYDEPSRALLEAKTPSV